MLQCLPEPPDSWLASCLRKSILRDVCGGGAGGSSAIDGATTTVTAGVEVVVMLVVEVVVVVVVVVVLLYVDIWASSTLTERFNIFIECSSIHLYKKISNEILCLL